MNRPRRRAVLFIVIFALFAGLLGVLPSIEWVRIYANSMGRPISGLEKAVIACLWMLVLYFLLRLFSALLHLCFHKLYNVTHGHKKIERKRPRNMFDDVMDALDRMAAGDFDVTVEGDQQFHYYDLADKVNKLARDLSSMEQMRQEFISNVSHEIQSPLTSISGFAALLKREDLTKEQRLHYLEVIEAESRRLSKLSDSLMRLSVLDSGQKTLERKPYRLDKQLESILLLLEPQWSEKGQEPEADLTPVTYTGDEDLLSQVWMNLLHNAVKFTPQGGSIRVALSETEEVTVTVSDSGPGIAEESLPRVFERFYKTDKSRDRSLGGNGLGLSLVQKVVELHGGRISVKSPQGEGAIFTVTLPKTPNNSEI